MDHFSSKSEQGETVAVNGDRYRAMLEFVNKILLTKIKEEDIGNIWFQQDECFDVLHPVIADRIISRRADVVWPPRSCDLTPLECYLWDVVKDKDRIREAIGEIQLHTIDNVLKN